MSWLRVYAGLCVKLNSKGSGVRGVKWWNLDHRTREFVMSLATCLRVATLRNFTAVRSWSPDKSTREFLLAISFIVK